MFFRCDLCEKYKLKSESFEIKARNTELETVASVRVCKGCSKFIDDFHKRVEARFDGE